MHRLISFVLFSVLTTSIFPQTTHNRLAATVLEMLSGVFTRKANWCCIHETEAIKKTGYRTTFRVTWRSFCAPVFMHSCVMRFKWAENRDTCDIGKQPIVFISHAWNSWTILIVQIHIISSSNLTNFSIS